MRYKIHFTDNYGKATIEVDGEDYNEVMQSLKDDPECDNIWVEQYNVEEGYWEA